MGWEIGKKECKIKPAPRMVNGAWRIVRGKGFNDICKAVVRSRSLERMSGWLEVDVKDWQRDIYYIKYGT